jgi:hypothetical protein
VAVEEEVEVVEEERGFLLFSVLMMELSLDKRFHDDGGLRRHVGGARKRRVRLLLGLVGANRCAV